MSARELQDELELMKEQIREEVRAKRTSEKNYLFDSVDEDMADYLESVRLGKNEIK